jgi:hypothetical protein
MTEHYTNQKMAEFSVEKVAEFSVEKMTDKFTKWLRSTIAKCLGSLYQNGWLHYSKMSDIVAKMVEHYSKMLEFTKMVEHCSKNN